MTDPREYVSAADRNGDRGCGVRACSGNGSLISAKLESAGWPTLTAAIDCSRRSPASSVAHAGSSPICRSIRPVPSPKPVRTIWPTPCFAPPPIRTRRCESVRSPALGRAGGFRHATGREAAQRSASQLADNGFEITQKPSHVMRTARWDCRSRFFSRKTHYFVVARRCS